MNRPLDKEIYDTLDGRAEAECAARVAEWLSSDEGLLWLEENSDSLLSEAEAEASDSADGIPTLSMMAGIGSAISGLEKKKAGRRTAWAVAAALLPFIILSALLLDVNTRLGNPVFAEIESVTESANPGERKTLMFQDGTRVRLNSGTSVEYPRIWNIRDRRISMSGEAYFDVASNRRRPFVIDVGDAEIKVYGTSFNLKAYPEDRNIDLVLVEGKVVFETDGNEYDVEPCQKLVYDRQSGDVKIVQLENPEEDCLWTEDILVFRNSPLNIVLENLSRWYGVEFDVADTSLYRNKFTFRTKERPLSTILREMEYISGIDFTENDDLVVVSRK